VGFSFDFWAELSQTPIKRQVSGLQNLKRVKTDAPSKSALDSGKGKSKQSIKTLISA
jgi:hypothetical protein